MNAGIWKGKKMVKFEVFNIKKKTVKYNAAYTNCTYFNFFPCKYSSFTLQYIGQKILYPII